MSNIEKTIWRQAKNRLELKQGRRVRIRFVRNALPDPYSVNKARYGLYDDSEFYFKYGEILNTPDIKGAKRIIIGFDSGRITMDSLRGIEIEEALKR